MSVQSLTASQSYVVPRPLGDPQDPLPTPSVVIGPWTSLGISALIPYEGRSISIIGEGGHVTVAPNLVLSFGARGGVYITGGIVLKMDELFKSDVFLDGFVDKGRLRGYMNVIPSFVVTHTTPAFLGLKEL